MADDDIVQEIKIEGTDQIEQDLESVGSAGEASFKKIESSANAAAQATDKMATASKQVAQATQSAASGAEALAKAAQRAAAANKEMLDRAAKSVERRGGPTAEEFRQRQQAFQQGQTFDTHGVAIVAPPKLEAAAGGAVGLAASLTGGLVVSLEKTADAANDASVRLGGFLGSLAKGQDAFAGLQKIAPSLQTTAGALAPAMEQLLRINQQLPTPRPQADLTQALDNLLKGMQAERVPTDKAIEALTALLTDIRKQGSSPRRTSSG
jgi:hypothetical protein